MAKEIYNFKVGAFKCAAVSDGTMTYAPPDFPPPAVFLCVNAPRDTLAKRLGETGQKPEEWREWTSSYTCLFIDTGKHKVLVDTGAGSLSPTTGRLTANLKKMGITPADIDSVILSHAHPDHVGGNLNPDGTPVFSRAHWITGKEEWQFWTTELAEHQLDEHSRDTLINIARRNLIPLKDRIELIGAESEIVPGVKAIAAPGHTPGQIGLEIKSEGERLLYIADIIIHPFHVIEPEWFAAVDVIPEKVIATRRNMLQRAAAEKLKLMAFHFAFPGLGYIVEKDNRWAWQPV